MIYHVADVPSTPRGAKNRFAIPGRVRASTTYVGPSALYHPLRGEKVKQFFEQLQEQK
jgi:hypothetical protein